MAKSLRREQKKHHPENGEQEAEVFKSLAGLNRSILKGLVRLRGEPPISRTRELSMMLEEVMWHAQETRIILKEMQSRYRLSKQTVHFLVEELTVVLERPTQRSGALPVHIQLLTALRFYAVGTFQIMHGDEAQLSQPTLSRIISTVSHGIAGMRNRYIQFPSRAEDLRRTQEEFFRYGNFPGVIGTIDGSHIPICSPGGPNALFFLNRKNRYSINVQAVCDCQGRFTNIVARWPGSAHDSRMFNESALKRSLEETADGTMWLLGDNGAQMAPASFQDRATQTPRRWKKEIELSKKQLGTMQQFADEVCSAVQEGSKQGLPVIGESHRKHEAWCEQSYRHIAPTIHHWAEMIIKDKHMDARSERQKKMDLFEAEKIVSHFQRLFDVPSREGTYARMTEVYHRLEELNNILHTLKSLLGLRDDVPANRVVVALGHLCDLHSDTSTKLLSHLLQTDNLERLILCLDQYHKFFPVFESIAKDLMEILGVNSLGKVVPAVRALKLLHPY